MINELKQIIESSNSNYIVEFEEARMMNIKADELSKDAAFAYIEEYVQGSYFDAMYFKKKKTQIQIYFCRFSEFQIDAIEREAIRSIIENEIVLPFMEKYNLSGLFEVVKTWNFYTPLPRFDANEVSIMLQFDCTQTYC